MNTEFVKSFSVEGNPLPQAQDPQNSPNLSLILMTKDKHENLLPLLGYYSHYPLHVVIADGSTKRFNVNVKGFKHVVGEHSPGFTWSYMHNEKQFSFMIRLREALKATSTPYVALAPDDELLIWCGMVEAVNTLEANASLSAASGVSSMCKRFGKKLGFMNYLNYGFGKNSISHLDDWKNLNISSNNALERCRTVLYRPILLRFYYYRVYRKETLQNIIHLWNASKLQQTTGLGELVFALGTHCSGSSVFCPQPFWIRTLDSRRWSSSDFGVYDNYDLERLSTSLNHLMVKLGHIHDEDFDTQNDINSLLLQNFGQNSFFRRSLAEYSKNPKRNRVKRQVRELLERHSPKAALAGTNLLSHTRFSFEVQSRPLCGFGASEYSKGCYRDLCLAYSTLQSIVQHNGTHPFNSSR